MAAYRRVYDSRHLQADCQQPGSASEPYARTARLSSMGYVYLFSILQGIFQSCARSAPLEGSVRRPPRIKAQPSTDQIVTTQYSKGTVHTVTFPILLLLLLLLLLSSLSFYPLA